MGQLMVFKTSYLLLKVHKLLKKDIKSNITPLSYVKTVDPSMVITDVTLCRNKECSSFSKKNHAKDTINFLHLLRNYVWMIFI